MSDIISCLWSCGGVWDCDKVCEGIGRRRLRMVGDDEEMCE